MPKSVLAMLVDDADDADEQLDGHVVYLRLFHHHA